MHKSIFVLLFCLLSFIMYAQAYKKTQHDHDNQLPIVLVHGAAVSGGAWTPVIPLLKAPSISNPSQRGRTGNLPDVDPAIVTFQNYVDDIINVVNSVDRGHGVILVGHSFGGLMVSQVAENLGSLRIRALIYVAAYIPATGVVGDSFNAHLSADTNSVIPSWVTADPEGAWVTINNASAVFLNDCPDTNATRTEALVIESIKEPTLPFTTNVTYTDARFGKVPKYYIATDLDTAVTPEFQMLQYNNLKMEEVIRINAGHSPMFCKPQLLADAINPITSRVSDDVFGHSSDAFSLSYSFAFTLFFASAAICLL